MKYSESKLGRIFVLRLEDGEVVHTTIEQFAKNKKVKYAAVIMLGGADKDSRIVVGPEKGRSKPIVPMELLMNNVYEAAGVGTIFPNSKDKPVLHLHSAFGRKNIAYTGCIRAGVKTWHVMEVVIFELKNTTARRKLDPKTGFELLSP